MDVINTVDSGIPSGWHVNCSPVDGFGLRSLDSWSRIYWVLLGDVFLPYSKEPPAVGLWPLSVSSYGTYVLIINSYLLHQTSPVNVPAICAVDHIFPKVDNDVPTLRHKIFPLVVILKYCL